MRYPAKIFGTAGRVERATERCDLHCDWCGSCRNTEIPAEALSRLFASPPPTGTSVLRIRGGDPFRYGDIQRWVAWGRQQSDAAICIEGPAASLAGSDRADVIERILQAQPDAVSVVLPTIAKDRTAALTGKSWDPQLALASLRQLGEAGLAVEVVFPIHPDTVHELAAVTTMAANSIDGGVYISLRNSPPARQRGARDWSELDVLSSQLRDLPAQLPGAATLQFDPSAQYAPCMLTRDARRRDLFSAPGQTGTRPLGATCDACAWNEKCTFRNVNGIPPVDRVQPLTTEETLDLLSPQASRFGAEPRPFNTDRASVGLPNYLCFAPWTCLSACEPRFHPVPCALSWVDTEMTPEQFAVETGNEVEEERRRAALAAKEIPSPSWYVTDNERLSLMELWNSPLLRLMRREMTTGKKSSRCRDMCRVVMGVEERGIANFTRPDSDFTPQIIANRNHLLEEIHAGKNVLTAKPLDLVMGVSAHCNISCGFCDGPLGAYGELSDRRRDEIIEMLPSLMNLGVSGPGEPLMSKNYLALLEHISDTVYPGLLVNLTTNGTLLTPEFLARNKRVPWSSVRISLNSGSAETYRRMTGGKDHFDRILTNLDALCDLRERTPRGFSITLSLVLGKVQMGDMAKFAQIVHDHRTSLVVEPMYDNRRNLSPWLSEDGLHALIEEIDSVADAYVEKNPDISRAFRAVGQFARSRRSLDASIMRGH